MCPQMGACMVVAFFFDLCLLMCSLPWKVGDSVEGEMPRIKPAQTLTIKRAAVLFFSSSPRRVQEAEVSYVVPVNMQFVLKRDLIPSPCPHSLVPFL